MAQSEFEVTVGHTYHYPDGTRKKIGFAGYSSTGGVAIFKEREFSDEAWYIRGGNVYGPKDPARSLVAEVPPKMLAALEAADAILANPPTMAAGDTARIRVTTPKGPVEIYIKAEYNAATGSVTARVSSIEGGPDTVQMVKNTYASMGIDNPDKAGLDWWVAQYNSGAFASTDHFLAAFKHAVEESRRG
jgi:hypothetical protein